MEIKKLDEGTTIGVDSSRLQFPLYGDPPRMRVGAPGTILSNVAMGWQIAECSKLKLGNPEPSLVKVVFRQVGSVLYLLVVPVTEAGTDVYELKYEGRSRAPVIRQLKPLFESAKIALRGEVWYDMASELVDDKEHGLAVGGQWTSMVTTPRGDGEKDVAAAEMTGE